MDSSNRLAVVFGEHSVDAGELQPAERAAIMERVLNVCRPNLKYLPKFRPIHEILNRSIGYGNTYDQYVTDEQIVEFPPDVNREMKIIFLTQLSFETEGSYEGGCRFIMQVHLLLTIKGQLICWDQKYRRVSVHGLGYRGHRTGMNQVAERSKFFYPDAEATQSIITTKVLKASLVGLHTTIKECVDERRRHMQSIEESFLFVDGVIRRIKNIIYY